MLCTKKGSLRLHGGSDDVHPLSELRQTSYNDLLKRIPPTVQLVLIGEGTHGTEEFCRIRSEVTQCLLEQHGFNGMLCEGDVHPFFELNSYVNQAANFDTAAGRDNEHHQIRSMLSQLFSDSFPHWMWSNSPFADLLSWMKALNCNTGRKLQIMGMDLLSPFASMDYILRQLRELGEDEMVRSINECYETFFQYRNDVRRYGNDIYANKVPPQENAMKTARDILLQKYKSNNAPQSLDDVQELQTWSELIRNAHAIVASEAYHRQRIYPGHVATWNLRTKFMFDSISRSLDHINDLRAVRVGNNEMQRPVRMVVWAHNSHVNCAGGYASLGQISLGQLCRETFRDDNIFLIGMTTYEGTVRAAHADRQGACYKGRGEVMRLKKAIVSSHEKSLHSIAETMKPCEEQAFGLYLRGMRGGDVGTNANSFNCYRPERFVGSCYLPQTEVMSHYTDCNLSTQFDYIIVVSDTEGCESESGCAEAAIAIITNATRILFFYSIILHLYLSE